VTTSRGSSQLARLARMGFADTVACQQVLVDCQILDSKLEFITAAADPDLALISLAQIISSGTVDAQSWSAQNWQTLAKLLGASQSLGQHLLRHCSHIGYVLDAQSVPSAEQMQQDLISSVAGLDWDSALVALRIAYRRQVCAIAGVDLTDGSNSVTILPGIAQALSDLADSVLASSLVIARRMFQIQPA